MSKQSYYEMLLKTMPAGVDRAILRIVSQRVGKENAIIGHEMYEMIKDQYGLTDQRQMREVIKQLRRKRHYICSAPGEKGGYWLAKDRAEYEEFTKSEFRSKIADLSMTLKAMNAGADEHLGPVTVANQETLF